jgi:hypothetical protein
MKYWYDTEFLEDGRSIELISIGIVAEDDRIYYAVNSSMDQQRVKSHPWLKDNVWPHLPTRLMFGDDTCLNNRVPSVLPKIVIAEHLTAFFSQDDDIELWAYYGAYDHVIMSWIWGAMIEQKGMPYYTNELMQLWTLAGKPEKPTEPENVHHALADAEWNKKLYDVCMENIK